MPPIFEFKTLPADYDDLAPDTPEIRVVPKHGEAEMMEGVLEIRLSKQTSVGVIINGDLKTKKQLSNKPKNK